MTSTARASTTGDYRNQRMSDMTDHLFISAGMHYYVAGRYAVFAGLNPTAANLLHHAVEMALKGALAKKGMDLKALRGLSHDLPRIWRDGQGLHRRFDQSQGFCQLRSYVGS